MTETDPDSHTSKDSKHSRHDEKRKNKTRLPGTRLNDTDAKVLDAFLELSPIGCSKADMLIGAAKFSTEKKDDFLLFMEQACNSNSEITKT